MTENCFLNDLNTQLEIRWYVKDPIYKSKVLNFMTWYALVVGVLVATYLFFTVNEGRLVVIGLGVFFFSIVPYCFVLKVLVCCPDQFGLIVAQHTRTICSILNQLRDIVGQEQWDTLTTKYGKSFDGLMSEVSKVGTQDESRKHELIRQFRAYFPDCSR